MIIVVDVDGTIGDFTLACAECIVWMTEEPHARVEEAKSVCESEWAGPNVACELFGVDPELFWPTMFTKRWTNQMQAVPGAALALNDAVAAGHTVRYHTARTGGFEEWLYVHGFPSAGDVLYGGDKIAPLRAMMAEGREVVLIDDRPDTVVAAVTAGVPILVPVHQYNAEVLKPPAVPLPAWCMLDSALRGVGTCR